MAVASLVLGIVSIVFSFIPLTAFKIIGAVLAAGGIFLGAFGRKVPEKRGIGTAGMILSIVGFVLCVILWIACAAAITGTASYLNSYY